MKPSPLILAATLLCNAALIVTALIKHHTPAPDAPSARQRPIQNPVPSEARSLTSKIENPATLAQKFAANEQRIVAELLAVQGKPVDLGGYYQPDDKKTSAVMRPSKIFNEILTGL